MYISKLQAHFLRLVWSDQPVNIIVKTAKSHTDLLTSPYTRQSNFVKRRNTKSSQIKLKINSFLLTKTCKKAVVSGGENKSFQLSRNIRLS